MSITSLIETSQKDLRTYLKRFLRSEEEVSDVCQEAYLKTFVNLDRAVIPRAFLFRTARNLAIDHLSHEKALSIVQLDDIDQFPSQSESIESILNNAQELDLLREAIETLPPKRKQILIKRVFFGLSYRALSKQFKIGERTVENHIALGIRDVTRHIRDKKSLR